MKKIMKKIAISSLVLLASSSVFAVSNHAVIKHDNVSGKKSSAPIYWSLDSSTDLSSIQNEDSFLVRVLISVDKVNYGTMPNELNDPISVNCNGKLTVVKPGSALVCPIASGTSMSFQVQSGNYANGSSGIYSIIE